MTDYNIFHNISHSGDYVICVISDAEIGCDIQKMDYIDEEELTELVWNFFSYKEAIQLQKTNDKRKYFYRLWTLKESYLKFCGDGLLKDLDSFSFIIRDKIIFEISDSVENFSKLKFWLSGYGKEYTVAICSIDNIDKVSLYTVDSNIIKNIINIC
ncbi:MAG: 4'-phosphopantetheinyl transferase superfamily protein [Lachnospiraceae bacterium]|nr:4'-phosphopantetheinyl transferase superfamily protein [Lachnospiraceae bacterium]